MTSYSIDFDLSNIFIAREQQLELFQLYLDKWKRLMNTPSSMTQTQASIAPSPNNKIQGLVVLLYGRGGFGKSTLLKYYHEIAREPDRHLAASKTIDWEFAIEGKRSIFNPPPGQEIAATEYYRVLCNQLADALGKHADQFRDYKAAVEAVEDARKQVDRALHGLQQDDRFSWLRKIASEEIVALVRTAIPASNLVPGIDKIAEGVKEGLDQGMQVGAEQARQLYTRLRDNLGHKLDDYLEPALKLGLSLGRDLARFAKDFPMLIFFDTYEEVDEGDKLLKIVMGAAGTRVGWVLAGRDNLWAGSEQRKRSTDMEYGYKDIVPPDRGLAIDFNAGGIGAFTLSDIVEYFSQLLHKVPQEAALPEVSEEDAAQILEVTQGVPLAVKIAAGLYVENANLKIITEKADGKRKVVDEMVRRYLLHTRADQHEKARLYGLALLRRADEPAGIAAALGLTPEQASTSYAAELSRLHRRYSFIFTEKAQPALHQEVRHFLRLWLLEHSREPEIVRINERLKDAHETALKKLEDHRGYGSLRERLEDEEWVGVYLDLTEQQFWLDPADGVRHCLPFMMAAAIYQRDANQAAASVGEFFEADIKQPYRNWWKSADESLIYTSSQDPLDEELTGLEELAKLVKQRHPSFPLSFLQEDYRQELEAALWWRLGEAYQNKDNIKALEWYEKALIRLGNESELKEAMAGTCYSIAEKLDHEKKHTECIPFLNKAIDLKPDYVWAYTLRGVAYFDLNDYQRAIQDYDQALALDPKDATAYYNRGSSYSDLKDYQRAIADYDRAIELDPKYAIAYHNRGLAYRNLKDYQHAIQDYDQAITLDPKDATAYHNRGIAYLWRENTQQAYTDYSQSWELDPTAINAPWMAEWAGMSKERIGIKMAHRLEEIAAVDPQHYVSFVCRGVALGLRGKLNEGFAELEQAIPLEPDEWDAYFWKGMICAYLGRNSAAMEALQKALEVGLPPVLLTPLYWLEPDRPDFFREYAEPLLKEYDV